MNNQELFQQNTPNPYIFGPDGKRLSSKKIFAKFARWGNNAVLDPKENSEIQARKIAEENRAYNMANPSKPKRSVNVTKIRRTLVKEKNRALKL